VTVDDPYNMYFTPDGKYAINVAEARKRLDFLDPHTMKVQSSLEVPGCAGVNHADFTIDGRYAIFTCEFQGSLVKIDVLNHTVVGYLQLSQGGMPQDIRSSPDGNTFYVAEMMRGGVYTIDPNSFIETGFIPTGIGTHGLYPSRDGTKLYIANRGSTQVGGPPGGPGSVSVLDFATKSVVATWPIPGGGSPDMGNVSADGKVLWLSGRYDNVVYAIDTTSGSVTKIPGAGAARSHRWPQPAALPQPHRQHATSLGNRRHAQRQRNRRRRFVHRMVEAQPVAGRRWSRRDRRLPAAGKRPLGDGLGKVLGGGVTPRSRVGAPRGRLLDAGGAPSAQALVVPDELPAMLMMPPAPPRGRGRTAHPRGQLLGHLVAPDWLFAAPTTTPQARDGEGRRASRRAHSEARGRRRGRSGRTGRHDGRRRSTRSANVAHRHDRTRADQHVMSSGA
jgi:hypothetical protein